MFPQHSVHMWHIFTCDTWHMLPCHVWHILTSSPDQVALLHGTLTWALHHHCSYTWHTVSPWSPYMHIYYLLSTVSSSVSVPVCSRYNCPGQLMAPASWWCPGAVLVRWERTQTQDGMRWRRGYTAAVSPYSHFLASSSSSASPAYFLPTSTSLSLVLSNDQTCKWLVKHH